MYAVIGSNEGRTACYLLHGALWMMMILNHSSVYIDIVSRMGADVSTRGYPDVESGRLTDDVDWVTLAS